MTAIVTAILSAVAAFVGSWLAARFALDRFKHEKIWERRAAAYTAILESLYDVEKTLREALVDDKDGGDGELFKASLESVARRAQGESWLLSKNFRQHIIDLTELRDIGDASEDDMLKRYAAGLRKRLSELTEIARIDLSIK